MAHCSAKLGNSPPTRMNSPKWGRSSAQIAPENQKVSWGVGTDSTGIVRARAVSVLAASGCRPRQLAAFSNSMTSVIRCLQRGHSKVRRAQPGLSGSMRVRHIGARHYIDQSGVVHHGKFARRCRSWVKRRHPRTFK
jgi:hypothetical protein